MLDILSLNTFSLSTKREKPAQTLKAFSIFISIRVERLVPISSESGDDNNRLFSVYTYFRVIRFA